MWTSVAELVTPSSLFLFLNLTIAAIALTSRRNTNDNDNNSLDSEHRGSLDRVPSLLERVRSVNLYSIYNMASSLSQIQTDDVINDDVITGGGYYSLPLPTTPTAVPAAAASLSLFHKPSRLSRPQLDTCIARVEPPSAAAAAAAAEVGRKKMRKSASVKCTEVVALTAAAKEEEVRLEKRRPATVRLQKTVSIGDECGGVDSKADDFINRFKQQLKLQRVDSLLRRKELVKARAMQARGLKTY